MPRHCTRFFMPFALAGALFATSPALAETMKAAVTAAVTENPRALASDAEVKTAALELLQQDRDYLPTVSVYGEAGPAWYWDPARLSPADNNKVSFGAEAGVVAEYTLFDGYRRANTTYAAAARVDGAIFRLLDASETLALNAVEAYIDVFRHRQLVNIARENISRHENIAGQVADLVEGGKLPVSDQFDVDQRVLAAKLYLVQVREALAKAEARYENVVGHKPGHNLRIQWLRSLPMTKDALIRQALQGSARIKALDALVQATRYDGKAERADERPQVKLRAGANVGQNLDGVPGFQSDAYAGLLVEWKVFEGGRSPRRAAAAQRTNAEQFRRDEAVRDVREMAAEVWASYEANIERTVLFDRQLAAARGTVEQYQDQFLAGTRTLIQVLDAERAYFNIRFEDISAEAAYVFNQYQMLAVQSRLAAHFGVAHADVPLMPDFEARALDAGDFTPPSQVFGSAIPSLE